MTMLPRAAVVLPVALMSARCGDDPGPATAEDPAPKGSRVPGNPTVSRPLPLDEQLGDRELLDGSTYPPTPVGPSLRE